MERLKKNKLIHWLHERYDLTPLFDFIEHKQVPVHKHSIWYYTGGVTLFLFIIQVCTGILLLFYYQPGADTSYESVRFIMTKVSFGWLIRSIHSWSANLMIFFAFIHMFSVFFSGAYKKPRELTWVTGFGMLLLAMGFGFSGYLLPWNELAFFATKVGTDIVGDVPVIGELIKQLLRGGPDVTAATIYRFYAIHVNILPLIFFGILVAHLFFVQLQGMHEPDYYRALAPEQKRTMPFFPNFFLRDVLFWLLVLDVLLFLAVFFPWDLGIKADPFASAPAGIHPEWYFMFMFQSLKYIPATVFGIEGELLGILFFGVLGALWLTVPFWEAKIAGKKRPWLMKVIGVVALAYMIVLTIIAYLA